jgi:hypothetical protein
VGLTACDAEEIVSSDESASFMAPATSWNGVKVYLSSPRHADSGNRGECAGWEENINGRAWNWYAATGDYWNDAYNPNHSGRNFRARGYQVTVSANTRDNGWSANRAASNAWNATVHIVSHTNASSGCGAPGRYTLGIWDAGDAAGQRLATRLSVVVDDVAPGGRNNWSQDLGELHAQAPWRAYVELVFHTDPLSQTWMHGSGSADKGAQRYSWRYGAAVDNELGYP